MDPPVDPPTDGGVSAPPRTEDGGTASAEDGGPTGPASAMGSPGSPSSEVVGGCSVATLSPRSSGLFALMLFLFGVFTRHWLGREY